MIYDQNTVRTLYEKLLALYPRTFRAQLGESIEQTFNDLYKERQPKGGQFGFVLWMFVETGVGILQEHILLLTQGNAMKNIISNPTSAAITGFAVPAAGARGRNLLSKKNTLRSRASFPHNCPAQSAGQLCYKKRHE